MVEGCQNSVISTDVALSSSVMPPTITSLRLAVEPVDDCTVSREQRRAYVSPDVLRTYKIPAGSWAVLATGKKYAVVQLWPRASAGIEGVSMSQSSRTYKLMSLVVSVNATRFPEGTEGQVDMHLFEPSSARIVKSVTLSSSSSAEDSSSREKDWMISHLKEELGKSRDLGRD